MSEHVYVLYGVVDGQFVEVRADSRKVLKTFEPLFNSYEIEFSDGDKHTELRT